jgi:hypothetical protein
MTRVYVRVFGSATFGACLGTAAAVALVVVAPITSVLLAEALGGLGSLIGFGLGGMWAIKTLPESWL